MLIDEVAGYVVSHGMSRTVEVVDYGFGVRYTYLILRIDDREYVGVTHTLINNMVGKKPYLAGLEFDRLPEYVSSINPYLKQLGHSMINAYNQYLLETGQTVPPTWWGDPVEYVDFTGRRIVFIGDLRPIVGHAAESGAEVYVFDANPCRRDLAYPAFYYYRVLGKADTVFVSGSAITNDSIDDILRYTMGNALVLLTGPSASIPVEPVRGRGIGLIASIHIPSSKTLEVAWIVRRGGGTRHIGRAGRKYIQAVEPEALNRLKH